MKLKDFIAKAIAEFDGLSGVAHFDVAVTPLDGEVYVVAHDSTGLSRIRFDVQVEPKKDTPNNE